MRYFIIVHLLFATLLTCGCQNNPQGTTGGYEGKYEMNVRGKAAYIIIATKNKRLTLFETWSGVENKLKHLSGDNFIIELRGWAVKFNRDVKGEVVSVRVMGHDVWTKIK